MDLPDNFDMTTVTQMLQSLGVSPDRLGPDRINKLMKLTEGVTDPSQVSAEKAREIISTLGISAPKQAPKQPARKVEKKIGRNAPCICESGKKYKKCCGQ